MGLRLFFPGKNEGVGNTVHDIGRRDADGRFGRLLVETQQEEHLLALSVDSDGVDFFRVRKLA